MTEELKTPEPDETGKIPERERKPQPGTMEGALADAAWETFQKLEGAPPDAPDVERDPKLREAVADLPQPSREAAEKKTTETPTDERRPGRDPDTGKFVKAKDPAVEKAFSLLKLDGVAPSVLERMTEEELLEAAAHQTPRRDRYQQTLDRVAELEAQLRNLQQSPSDAPPAKAAASPDAMEQAIQKLSEEYGEEAGEALKPIVAELKALRSGLDQQREAETQRMVESNLRSIAEKYSHLDWDEATRKQLLDEVDMLAQTGRFAGKPEQAFEKAALLAFGPPMSESASVPETTLPDDRGQMTTPSRTEGGKGLDPWQRAYKKFAMAEVDGEIKGLTG